MHLHSIVEKPRAHRLYPALNNQGNQAYIDLIADQQGAFHIIWLGDSKECEYQSLRCVSFIPESLYQVIPTQSGRAASYQSIKPRLFSAFGLPTGLMMQVLFLTLIKCYQCCVM